ncbi:uncharacterized protein LOC131425600 [Malaya genurostris]|uniref:uncharacterized protein LOC131425600 n=1 Tax=Malaya genurostris TaxID=325434 RepID=UPI0026F3E0ED|nr:uncharacterized protein LOC131425600 [Malaya genurostris]
MVERLMHDSIYPTTEEKKMLAIKILLQFPFLCATRRSTGAPEYSLFFWKNGGQGPKHEHTGLIHTHLRNSCKNLLPEQRKFTHSKKVVKHVGVCTEIIDLAEMCAKFGATSANYSTISKMMSDVHDLHMMLLNEKNDMAKILLVLPHLTSYNGRMIHMAYERIHGTSFNQKVDLRKVFAKGLMHNQHAFKEVSDDYIRGCLRIMIKLTRKGIKYKETMEPNIGIETELAAPLIRWISDSQSIQDYNAPVSHIFCQSEKFFVYLSPCAIIPCGKESINAIDTFFRSFAVFNLRIPVNLLKIADFLDVFAYKIKSYSNRSTVQNLCSLFIESENAEKLL